MGDPQAWVLAPPRHDRFHLPAGIFSYAAYRDRVPKVSARFLPRR